MAAIEVPVDVLEAQADAPICVKTGLPAETTFEQRFTYVPPGVIFLFFFGILPGVIGLHIATREVTLELPAAGAVVEGQRRHFWISMLAVVIGLVTLLTALAGPAWTWYRDASWVVFPASFIIAIVSAWFGRRRYSVRGTLSPDQRTVTLKGVHPEFARRLDLSTRSGPQTMACA